MSGLLALLDDIAALAKVAAATIDDAAAQAGKAGAKAAGIVIDDAAVTPRYVTGLAARRELPIIGRIALGSLKNKLLILLPAALLLSQFAPGAITPILMLGGLYLAFEGYEKFHHLIAGDSGQVKTVADVAEGSADAQKLENERVAGAIRTDFILSAEIMAIALSVIETPDVVTRGVVLGVVGLFMTMLVYGAVALIVKADDMGVWLARRGGPVSGPLGRLLVRGVPPFLRVLSVVGTIAMLWVGGGILIHSLAVLGYPGPEHLIHGWSEAVRAAVPVASGVFAWLTGTLASAAVGLLAGAIVVFAIGLIRPLFGAKPAH
jgi:predicted DNA repair protein MutK